MSWSRLSNDDRSTVSVISEALRIVVISFTTTTIIGLLRASTTGNNVDVTVDIYQLVFVGIPIRGSIRLSEPRVWKVPRLALARLVVGMMRLPRFVTHIFGFTKGRRNTGPGRIASRT